MSFQFFQTVQNKMHWAAHGNEQHQSDLISNMVDKTKKVEDYTEKPIVFNEDNHFEFEKDTNNFVAAVKMYASWGYFDFRLKGETDIKEGYQSHSL
jgi:hypothetical protein